MKNIILGIAGVIVTAIAAVAAFGVYKFNFTNGDMYLATGGRLDSKDGTYVIEGEHVTLKDGYWETSDPRETVRYFGNDVKADFNGDGAEDTAFLLTRDAGGSGTFFYVAAQVSRGSGFVGTNAMLLGDRIAPQTTEYRDRLIIVNYADRRPEESFSVQPSLGVSRYFRIAGTTLEEVSR